MSQPNGEPLDEPLDEQTRRDLAALADGSLDPARREQVEALVTGSPRLQALLREQRSALAAIARDDEASPALRERIATERPRWRRRARLRLSLVPAAIAVAALALVLAAPEGAGERASVASAATLSERVPTDPPPAVSERSWRLLDMEAQGVHYPNWQRTFGWRPVGSRDDQLGGRSARTLFYEKDGRRIGYTILSGSPLPYPRESHPVKRWGTRLASARIGDLAIVTWRRKGRTCVLAGKNVAASEMVDLGAWRMY